MKIQCKTKEQYNILCGEEFSLPMGFPFIDIDPDFVSDEAIEVIKDCAGIKHD